MRWVEKSRSDTDVVWIATTDDGEPIGLARYDFADGSHRVVEIDPSPVVGEVVEAARERRLWPWVVSTAVSTAALTAVVIERLVG